MKVSQAIRDAAWKMPVLNRLLGARRYKQRQRDWTRVSVSTHGQTTLMFQTNPGLGDMAIVRQCSKAFTDYCAAHGDPNLGVINIVGGAWPLEFPLKRGDFNLYWWWSMNGRADWLETYLAQTPVKPDAVCCLSPQGCEQAARLGVATVLLPLAVGDTFKPLALPRQGVGYAGSKGHKDPAQESVVIGPFLNDTGFAWVNSLTPDQLCEFYNRKQIVLGMTETLQEQAGMVNNRVFEVLATDTPFILHRHRSVGAVLGVEFPYLTDSPERTRALSRDILGDYEHHLAVFAGYGKLVRERHTYARRIDTLIGFLKRERVRA